MYSVGNSPTVHPSFTQSMGGRTSDISLSNRPLRNLMNKYNKIIPIRQISINCQFFFGVSIRKGQKQTFILTIFSRYFPHNLNIQLSWQQFAALSLNLLRTALLSGLGPSDISPWCGNSGQYWADDDNIPRSAPTITFSSPGWRGL